MHPDLVNHVTNAAGTFIGLPDVVSGVTTAASGDLVGGILQALKGACEFCIAYFVGKS